MQKVVQMSKGHSSMIAGGSVGHRDDAAAFWREIKEGIFHVKFHLLRF